MPELAQFGRRVALVDRDGTIIRDCSYALRVDQIELLPGAAFGLRKLREMGFGVIVVTNQSPIGRGLLTEQTLEAIHARMREPDAGQCPARLP